MSMVASWALIISTLIGIFENRFIAFYVGLVPYPPNPSYLVSCVALGGSFTCVRFIGACPVGSTDEFSDYCCC